MKKLLTIPMLFVCLLGMGQAAGGGNVFSSISIGTQKWMSKNLDVTTYRNGDVIPQVTDPDAWGELTTGAWCYYKNDSLNGAIYGKLYNWYAVNDSRGLAPQGWHIPTDAEWTTLGTLLGGDAVAGGKMKTKGSFKILIDLNDIKFDKSATNESGFAGLPGGKRGLEKFNSISEAGYWWSASKDDDSTYAWYRFVTNESGKLNRYDNTKLCGFSVRCLRD